MVGGQGAGLTDYQDLITPEDNPHFLPLSRQRDEKQGINDIPNLPSSVMSITGGIPSF